MRRLTKDEYYFNITEAVYERSTCLRRKYGAIIVKDDNIISTGYNGRPRGETNCIDLGYCERQKRNIPPGERYDLCGSCHAEANALLHAGRKETIGAVLYIAGYDLEKREKIANALPCSLCQSLILNAGVGLVKTLLPPLLLSRGVNWDWDTLPPL